MRAARSIRMSGECEPTERPFDVVYCARALDPKLLSPGRRGGEAVCAHEGRERTFERPQGLFESRLGTGLGRRLQGSVQEFRELGHIQRNGARRGTLSGQLAADGAVRPPRGSGAT